MSDQAQTAADSVYTLRRPITFDGQEYTQINLDFDRLTGEDILNCDRQYAASQGSQLFFRESDKAYQAIVAARAAGVPVELIKSLYAKDFTRVTLRAQNFLIGSA